MSDYNIAIACPIPSNSGQFSLELPKGKTIDAMNKIIEKKHKVSYPKLPSCNGFCFCIRKSITDKIGYFDEIFGKGYHEEVDYCYRAIQNGFNCVLIDNLYVFHKRQASFGKEKREILIEQNDIVFNERWKNFEQNWKYDNCYTCPVEKIKNEIVPIKIFRKEKVDAIRRRIYFCGIKLFSYKRKINEVDSLKMEISQLKRIIEKDNNLVFKYLTEGLELYPATACEMVIIDNYKEVLNSPEIYPKYYVNHIYRYLFADRLIKNDDKVLDIACGSGYGSKLIAQNTSRTVIGGDIAPAAVNFANRTKNTASNLNFQVLNALNSDNSNSNEFNKIVSFEILEHVEESMMKVMLTNFYNWLEPKGTLIASTPNETICPHDTRNPYHFKHYKTDEIIRILKDIGFENIKINYQYSDNFIGVRNNIEGKYIIFTANKK